MPDEEPAIDPDFEKYLQTYFVIFSIFLFAVNIAGPF